MNIKLKWVVAFETLVILILVAAVVNLYASKIKTEKVEEMGKIKSTTGLLSPRIYAGLLEPKSHLIVNFAPLKEKIQTYITKNNLNASVYVENFRNGAFMGINEKTGFFPASLNKLPVAILIMRDIESGALSFDTKLKILDTDRTDSSGELYKTKENELPLRFVLEKMLKESDNTALRVLLHYIDLEDLQFTIDYYGLDINVDLQKQQREKKPDLITPKAMSTLFSSLYFSTVLEPGHSEYLLSLLNDTVFPIKQIANLPDDVAIVHKFGENFYGSNKFFHECGIMYIEQSRIFYCVMTKNLSEEAATETIGVVVNEIYHYVKETRIKLDTNYRKPS